MHADTALSLSKQSDFIVKETARTADRGHSVNNVLYDNDCLQRKEYVNGDIINCARQRLCL